MSRRSGARAAPSSFAPAPTPPALPVARSSRAPPAFRAHRARRADFAASSKRAELHAQLNVGIKMGSPNGDPIKKLFGFVGRLPDALQPLRRANELALSYLEELHQANELALSYLDHSTRQGFGNYVVGLSRNSFTVDLHATLVDHATSIARRLGKT